MEVSRKHLLLVLVALLCTLQLSYGSGDNCPISLPQNYPSSHECYTHRLNSLLKRREIYSLKEEPPLMPYPRLNMSAVNYVKYLQTEPFLGFHAKLLAGNKEALEAAMKIYKQMTATAPNIAQPSEYQRIIDFFGKVPTQVLGDYMRKPSDFELFQQDKTSWISDELFGDQRVAGNNPMVLRQVTFSDKRGINWNELNKTLNPNFDWQQAFSNLYGQYVNANYQEISLVKAIEDGHIFVLRHRLCDDIPIKPDISTPSGDHHPRDLWPLYSPIALFASVPTMDKKSPYHRRLRAFAIQMDYKPNSTVYTPQNECAWTLAKLNVQLTDLLHGQLVEHLSKVHFTAEALCISIERHLSKYHPLYVIMKYHCRGVISSNTLGAPMLVSPHGFVDELFPVGWEGALLLINRAFHVTNWEDMDLETDVKKRGLDNEEQLPYYPYRDDGKELVTAIKEMLNDYIKAYYRNDYDVASDYELQAYVNEVSDQGKGEFGGAGKVRGFPASIDSKKKLVDTFARIIWLLVGQHTAVNFPMSDYSLYTSNIPTKLYNDSRGPSMQFSIYNLPYRVTVAAQNRVFHNLGLLRLDRLFDYGPFLADENGREVLYKHHTRLQEKLEPLLDKRNKNRYNGGFLTYPYFLPRWLPNGIQT